MSSKGDGSGKLLPETAEADDNDAEARPGTADGREVEAPLGSKRYDWGPKS